MIPLPPNAKIERMSRCSHRSQRVHNASAVVSVKDRDLRYIFAVELSKANEALRGCLDALATVPKLDESVGRVMASITCQLGAASSTLQLCNFEDNALNLEFVFQDGRVVSPEEVSYPEPWRSIPLEEERFASLGDRITVRRVADPREPIPDSHRRYLLELGIKTVLVVPLVSLNQAVGRLTFRFTDDRSFRPAELEIARALASQASLAVQLTRLAEAARESAVLEERRLLAGEIHDSLAQNFATVSMQLSAAEDAINTGRSDGLSYVKRANELARFGLAEARRSALCLQAATIEECGLIEALELLVERSNVSGRVSCTFVSHGIRDENLPLSAQQHLLRITQEAISNALRHAKPTAINVSLRLLGSNLVLEVTDNGSGIRRVKLEPKTGFGFVNMRRRVEKLSGLLELRTALGHGTSIVVSLPIN
jgi:signal transduction histidine kinase